VTTIFNRILVVVDDLIFLSKIRQTASLLNVPLEMASPATLCARMAQAGFAAVILDLNHSSGKAMEVVRAAKAANADKNRSEAPAVPVVGFVSHVQADLVEQARKAGCDVVLARSAFSQRLPEILRMLAAPKSSPELPE
jgi:DNA-binding NarL/FixJ family response regulator